MKKLTMKTKPTTLTLGQMWELFLLDTGVETSEFIIKTLDLFYPKLDRESMNVFDKMKKYYQVKPSYSEFLVVIKGMVGNGN